MPVKKTKAKTQPEFVFEVVLWSDNGNKLLQKKTVTVKRATLTSARDFIAKKYPKPYFFELKR